MKIAFTEEAHFSVELSQNGKTHSMHTDDSCTDYLSNMKHSLGSGRMTMAISNWGQHHSDMEWLDGDTGCQGECNNNPTVVYRNL